MLRRRPWLVPPIVIIAALGAGLAWWLLSPLLISTTVQEKFPLAATALVPENMTRAEVEQTMAGMAKVTSEMNEEMAAAIKSAVVAKSGSLRDGDSFHKGRGQALVYRLQDGSSVLRLESINVTNGPDLHVILTPHPSPATRAEVHAAGYADLGKLKGNIGSQNYPVPAQVDVAVQGSVVIYCLPFHVVFSVAPLRDTR